MDIEPFKILNSSITNGDNDVANSNDIDNIHELFQENMRKILNMNKDEEIVLSEVEKRFIQIALKKTKDLTAKEQIFLNDAAHLLEHMARREDILKADYIKVKDIQVGDLLILQDNENPDVEDLVVMANSEVNENYFRGIPVVFDENLASNVSVITALANDFGYENIFVKQIEALGEKKDLIIGISTSGLSENIINGLRYAKENGIKTIGMTGKDSNKMSEYCDYIINVPSSKPALIQQSHITIGQLLCLLIEEYFFNK